MLYSTFPHCSVNIINLTNLFVKPTNFATMAAQCGNYGNLLSMFFGKNFVKVKVLLNSWFDEIYFQWEWIFHFSTECMACVSIPHFGNFSFHAKIRFFPHFDEISPAFTYSAYTATCSVFGRILVKLKLVWELTTLLTHFGLSIC